MSMTKKDYVLLANIVRMTYDDASYPVTVAEGGFAIEVLDRMVVSMADAFQRDNEQFDRERFIEACTPRWHKRKI